MTDKLKRPTVICTLTIFLCFLLTSTGHLSWMYHLLRFVPEKTSDLLTTVAGYFLQAGGMAVFALLAHTRRIKLRAVFVFSLILYYVCLIPAVLSTSAVGTAAFGLLSSLLCGVIAGYYLYFLAEKASGNRRAVCFSVGYGAAAVGSWLLSLIDGGALYYGSGVLVICFALSALSLAAAFIKLPEGDRIPAEKPKPQKRLSRLLPLACAAVFVFSVVNNIGFSLFSPNDQNGFSLEFSRLFYAVGLVSAGFVNEKNRRYGGICALSALIIPFIVLALRGEPVSSSIFLALSYFAFGFFSVFRVILFSDIARQQRQIYLSGMGLLVGRLGDAAGMGIFASVFSNESAAVIAAAALFVAAVFLFFMLYQTLHAAPDTRQKSERQIFEEFAAAHDLSGREREVLRLVLQDRSNKEISEALYVSESTVKFHIHNLLQKTGCKSRLALKSTYGTMHLHE